MKYKIIPHTLLFKRPAKTSRNVFRTRKVFYVVLSDGDVHGIGEAAPLQLLSIDDVEDYEIHLKRYCQALVSGIPLDELDLSAYPSIRFGLETALNDMRNGGKQQIFDTPFYRGTPIRINGLVWMADIDTMLQEALAKIEQGFTCIKFKVGAHDFDAECQMLETIREKNPAQKLELRLDANGAFDASEALDRLNTLSSFDIHSIEQPIKPNQWEALAELCRRSPIDIALDEELIGVNPFVEGGRLLSSITPQYIILKPNLLGGYAVCDEWVKLCQQHNIRWWATSALESNIGLNGIAQWASQYDLDLPQGLGTGSLFENNIEGPLRIEGQRIVYGKSPWQLSTILTA